MQQVELADFDTSSLTSEDRQRLLRSAVLRVQLVRLAMKGLPASQAAAHLGISPATARIYYQEASFRQEVLGKVEGAFADVDVSFVTKRKTLHERLDEQAEASFDGLLELLQNKAVHPNVKVRIHQDFLNRSEQSKPLTGNTLKMDPEWLARASSAAREMDNVIELPTTKRRQA